MGAMDYQDMKKRAEAILDRMEAFAEVNGLPLGNGPQVQMARKIIEICERQTIASKNKTC